MSPMKKEYLVYIILPCLAGATWLLAPVNKDLRATASSSATAKSRSETPPAKTEPEPTPAPRASLTGEHRRLTEELLAAGKNTELNVELLNWFRADAKAARDWLDQREDFAPFQPALKMITEDFAVSGEPAAALEWLPLLTDPQLREDTLFSVMAAGRRNSRFTDAELRAVDLPPARITQLLSGAADD